MKNHIRYIARFEIETQSPLSIKTGAGDWLNDQLIHRDFFGLPTIPGTSLTGVLRAYCETITKENPEEQKNIEDIFGARKENKSAEEGKGSRIYLSNGYLVGANDTVIQTTSDFMRQESQLGDVLNKTIVRDRARITDKGVTEKGGKFDEEILPRGIRFRFELLLEGTKEDQKTWNLILNLIHQDFFRLGGQTRNGKGKFQVLSCKEKQLELKEKSDLDFWLNYSTNLNTNFQASKFSSQNLEGTAMPWEKITSSLKAKDFFITSSGFGAVRKGRESKKLEEQEKYLKIDQVYKKEKCFEYRNSAPRLSETEYILLPATSLKGALRHRTAFHYNKLTEVFVESGISQEAEGLLNKKLSLEILGYKNEMNSYIKKELNLINIHEKNELESLKETLKKLREFKASDSLKKESDTKNESISSLLDKEKNKQMNNGLEEHNPAICELFGYSDKENKKKGKVIINDIYIQPKDVDEQLFNHVKINRLTGGSFSGALFNELCVSAKKPFLLDIFIDQSEPIDPKIREAFGLALDDLKTGRLQFGGSVNKGHGAFLEEK